jgi:purine-binding chemotaxis protein CheW
MSLDVLFFEVRGRRCALPIAAVREVLAVPAVTPVPLAPRSIRGVVPVHGQALPLLDLGSQLAPGGAFSGPFLLRAEGDRVVVIEADTPLDSTPVQAALLVNRVVRIGTVNEEHSRPPPPGPSFVTATILDVEGPALLLDATAAIETVRSGLLQAVRP